jgi:hypothetical protein
VVQVVAAEGRVMFLHQTHLHQLSFHALIHLLIHKQSNHNPHIIRQHHRRRKYQRTLHTSLRKKTGILVVAMELVMVAILGHVVAVVKAVLPGPEMLDALLDQLKFSWPTGQQNP